MAGYIFPFHRNVYAARGKISRHSLDWRTLFDVGCYTVNGDEAYTNGGPFVTGGLLHVTRSALFAQQELRCITGEVYSRMNPTGTVDGWSDWTRRDLGGVVAAPAPAPSPTPVGSPSPSPTPVGSPVPAPSPTPVPAPAPAIVSSVGPDTVFITREQFYTYYDGIATVFNGPITRIDFHSGNLSSDTTVTFTGNTVVFSGRPGSVGQYGSLWVIYTPYGNVPFHLTMNITPFVAQPVGSSPVG